LPTSTATIKASSCHDTLTDGSGSCCDFAVFSGMWEGPANAFSNMEVSVQVVSL
jgi:hypothetical protein